MLDGTFIGEYGALGRVGYRRASPKRKITLQRKQLRFQPIVATVLTGSICVAALLSHFAVILVRLRGLMQFSGGSLLLGKPDQAGSDQFILEAAVNKVAYQPFADLASAEDDRGRS